MMKPLYVLLISFVLALIGTKLVLGHFDAALAGRIAMSIMLVFTAIAHFVFTKGMAMMIPDFIPLKKLLVYITGIIEVAAAVGLHIPAIRVTTAWLLIFFFILLLPANIHAAVKRIDYQKGTNDGPGLSYLWLRVPLQILFIAWTYFCAIQY
ncbi:MAG TPA: hypothetical protein VLC98_14390 [Phnomibacter sp.]|nr:hypothetical protein [Phnomibacter sp.]